MTISNFKAGYPISHADAFAAALAITRNGLLLTGDPEFKPLEKEKLIRIEWLA